MAGNVASPTSYGMLWLWVIGVIILGLVIAYGVIRAGRVRRSERARLDQRTAETQRQEDPLKRSKAGGG